MHLKHHYNKSAYVILAFLLVLIISYFVYAQYITSSEKEIISPMPVRNQESINDGVLKILTDKKIYQAGMPIGITITNNTFKPMIQNASSTVLINSNRYLGRNIGVGLIEKKEGDVWVAVESLWRCLGDCNKECETPPSIRSNENKEFIWDQQLTICSIENGTMEKERATPGVYRISIWRLGNNNVSEIDYSNEFKILNEPAVSASGTVPSLPLPPEDETSPALDVQ
jgi:hypothetical protein